MKSCCKDTFDNTIAEKPMAKGGFIKWLKYQATTLLGKRKNKLPVQGS